MIAHIVLFKPGASMSTEDRAAVLDSLISAMKQFPTVRGCRVGRRILHGLPGYEQLMREDYEYLLVVEFDSVDGLREYLRHPAHLKLGDVFTRAADASLAYDYEIVSLGEARRML